MAATARIASPLIPDDLKAQPVFLCIDDTMVPKSGTKFADASKLFDHAAHNGSCCLNGHCFVSIIPCVPVWKQDKISYLAVPLGYRMWQKEQSKLALAASMVRQFMPEFSERKPVTILCDSWYTKQNLISVIDEYPNLGLIGNARSGTDILRQFRPKIQTGIKSTWVINTLKRLVSRQDIIYKVVKWCPINDIVKIELLICHFSTSHSNNLLFILA